MKHYQQAYVITELSCFLIYAPISDVPLCPAPSKMKPFVPTEIYDATEANGVNFSIPIKVGQAIDFVCPAGLKLSFDNDTYVPDDDKYTIPCTALNDYIVSSNLVCIRPLPPDGATYM